MSQLPIAPRLEAILSPSLAREEMAALLAIEKVCYPPQTRFTRATIRGFLEMDGSLLVRAYVGESLAGFQIGNLNAGHLITLDVRPEFRRRGIGSAILRKTLSLMRRSGAPLIQCEIAVNNEASIRLHERFGFQALGRIPAYYEDGTDALLMALLLPGTPRFGPR